MFSRMIDNLGLRAIGMFGLCIALFIVGTPNSVAGEIESRAAWMEGNWGVRFVLPSAARLQELEEFDVDKVIDQLRELKSITWVTVNVTEGAIGALYTGPNSELSRHVHRWMVPKRDLLGEMLRALKAEGLRTMVYFASEGPRRTPKRRSNEDIDKQFPGLLDSWEQYRSSLGITNEEAISEKIIRYYSTRYGELIDGWWFDHAAFANPALYAAAARSGHSSAVVAFNRHSQGKLVAGAPEADYTAGHPTPLIRRAPSWPGNEAMVEQIEQGPHVDGVLGHIFMPLQRQRRSGPATFETEIAVDWTLRVLSAGGAFTWALADPYSSQLAERNLEQLREIDRGVLRSRKPNVVLILADDMGYGDIQAYNPDSKIPTPNLDTLANEGLRFTDAHTPSSVCTPTRYSLLTGRYAWRTSLKRGVLRGHSPLLIARDRDTLASVLQAGGYETAAIGKWHIGIGDSEAFYFDRLAPGPNAVGFDYFFGIPASLDMEPYVFIENEALATPLTGQLIDASGKRRDGGNGFWRKGQIGDGFAHDQVLPELAMRAVQYIENHAGSEMPFFLYFALPSPHTPWLPDEQHIGISGAGFYGDFVAMVDTVVGQVVTALEAAGHADDTIVIYTSDNGAHWLETDVEQYGHLANGQLRGQKADIHEGGHRVPLIVRWTGNVGADSVSETPMVLTDLFPTIVSLAGLALPLSAAPDGVDLSGVLAGQDSDADATRAIVHHSLHGMFAIRVGDWKLIDGLGSGGFTAPAKVEAREGEVPYQLYNLANDPAEKNSLASERPDIVQDLVRQLDAIRGAAQ